MGFWRTFGKAMSFSVDKSYKSMTNQFALGYSTIKPMVESFLVKPEVADIVDDNADQKERFKQAQAYFRLNEKALRNSQNNSHYYFLLIVGGLLILSVIEAFMMSRSEISITDILRFSLVPALLAMAARVSIVNAQIRDKSLYSFQTFIKTPSLWVTLPADPLPLKGKMAVMLTIIGSGLGLIFCFPNSAAAQSISQIAQSLPSTDLFEGMLEALVPGVGPVGSSIFQDNPITMAIAAAMSTFLSVIGTIGAGLLSYSLLNGMIEMAHKGATLGDKFHTTFAPLRVSAGFTSLVPAVKGYCMAQVLVLQVTVMGSNLANTIWTSYVSTLNTAALTNPVLPESMTLVKDITRLEICAAAADLNAQNAGIQLPSSRAQNYVKGPYSAAGLLSDTWHQVSKALTFGNATQNQQANLSRGTRTEIIWNYGACGKIKGTFQIGGSDAVATLDAARVAAISALRDSIKPEAQGFAYTNMAINQGIANPGDAAGMNFGTILSAKQTFDKAVASSIQAYTTSLNSVSTQTFVQQATAAGWLSAGTYFLTINNVGFEAAEVFNNRPDIIFSVSDKKSPQLNKIMFDETEGLLPRFTNLWDSNIAANPSISVSSARAGVADGDEEGISAIFSKIFSVEQMQDLLNYFEGGFQMGHALEGEIAFGGKLLNIGLGTMLIAFAGGAIVSKLGGGLAGVATKFIPGGSVISSIGSGLLTFIGMLGAVLLAVGFMHSMILPLLPFIHITMFGIGMLVLVAEALVGSVLWAFMHMRLEGNQFIDGPQRAGYVIIFNLLLRAPLMLFGLGFSLLILNAGEWLLSVTFNPAIAGITATSTFGPIAFIGTVVIHAVLCYMICTKAFGIITELPDRVSQWFGANAMGHTGKEEGTHISGAIVNATHTGMGAVTKGAGTAIATGTKGRGKGPGPGGDEAAGVNEASAITKSSAKEVEAAAPTKSNDTKE